MRLVEGFQEGTTRRREATLDAPRRASQPQQVPDSFVSYRRQECCAGTQQLRKNEIPPS